MTILIKIFCSFTQSKTCKEIYEKNNFSNEISFYGNDKQYYITENDDYTHAIIINTVMPQLKNIPKENVLGFAFEPIQFLGLNENFIEYAKKYIGRYFIGDKYNLPEPFIEHFGYMWYSRPPKEVILKRHLMSIIVTDKKYAAPGHMYRHNLIKTIIYMNLPVDIFGFGSQKYKYKRVKGRFENVEPFEKYIFSICIENHQSNHYFSEKVITPLMYNCTPVYLGCKNIDNYLDNVIKLTGDLFHDINTIINILRHPNLYYRKTYTEKNIKAVNLIENLPTLFP